MNLIQMQSMVKKHWREFCPQKAKELKATGKLEAEAHRVSLLAQTKKAELLQEGYRDFEADEVITREILLANPEPDEADQ